MDAKKKAGTATLQIVGRDSPMFVADTPQEDLGILERQDGFEQQIEIGNFVESHFCKFLGKPRRISLQHA